MSGTNLQKKTLQVIMNVGRERTKPYEVEMYIFSSKAYKKTAMNEELLGSFRS